MVIPSYFLPLPSPSFPLTLLWTVFFALPVIFVLFLYVIGSFLMDYLIAHLRGADDVYGVVSYFKMLQVEVEDV